jgi:hypothetical protein
VPLGYKLNPPGISICGKAATKSPRKVLKSSSWARHFYTKNKGRLYLPISRARGRCRAVFRAILRHTPFSPEGFFLKSPFSSPNRQTYTLMALPSEPICFGPVCFTLDFCGDLSRIMAAQASDDSRRRQIPRPAVDVRTRFVSLVLCVR